MSSLILRSATRFLVTLLLLFSLFLLLRGHNLPGGGFAGGLVAAAAFALFGIAFDVGTAREAMGIDPRTLIGIGLLLALGSGLPSMFLGQPFLTGQWGYVPLPNGHRIEIGTPLLFDVGVYLAVIGMTLTILFTLSDE
jgi:multicomponent Na+:H+ antiporter subunit B